MDTEGERRLVPASPAQAFFHPLFQLPTVSFRMECNGMRNLYFIIFANLCFYVSTTNEKIRNADDVDYLRRLSITNRIKYSMQILKYEIKKTL